MQSDMHYYGVYCLARAAGIKKSSATIIAYASQYIDDSVVREITDHEDGSRVVAVATAHHASDIKNIDHDDQRYIWVPFHFIPGGKGDSFTEKLLCRKDSPIAREMVQNNIAQNNEYILELVGITAHVYADTFAHYGFSGVSSRRNRVVGDSLQLLQSSSVVKSILGEKISNWFKEYGSQGGLLKNIRSVMSGAAELATGALGHGGVSIYPDQPYLKWQFEYEYPSGSVSKISKRDNQKTFFEGCTKLYEMLRQFVESHPEHSDETTRINFDDISTLIKEILAHEGDKFERASLWCKHAKAGSLFGKKETVPVYDPSVWHKQHEEFSKLTNPSEFAKFNIYKFFQAASYHKHYVLRELLTKYGIIVI